MNELFDRREKFYDELRDFSSVLATTLEHHVYQWRTSDYEKLRRQIIDLLREAHAVRDEDFHRDLHILERTLALIIRSRKENGKK